MQRHVNKVASSCFHHIRRLQQVYRLLGRDVTMRLVSAFVLSRLDYCNAVLAGLPKSTTAPLQRAQNAAARLVTGIGLRDHVTPALQQLHWLPVQYRITFKPCLLTHKIHTKRAPSYLTDKITATADLQSRAGLRSASASKYIRLQGHVSNSAREAFPMQDLLLGIVSHITFEKSRTLRDSKDNLKLFCFKGCSSTFRLFRFRFIPTSIFVTRLLSALVIFMQVFHYEL